MHASRYLKVQHRVTKAHSILSQANPVYIIKTTFLKIRFNTTVSSKPNSYIFSSSKNFCILW